MEIKLKHKGIQHITLENLQEHQPKKDYFVGLDSDGTIFDSMELKLETAVLEQTSPYFIIHRDWFLCHALFHQVSISMN